jgi:hypothetical protein
MSKITLLMLKGIDDFFKGFYESGSTFFQGFGALLAGGLVFKAFEKNVIELHSQLYLFAAVMTIWVFIVLHLKYKKASIEQPNKTQKANFNKNTTIVQEGSTLTSSNQEANSNEGGSITQK